MDNGNNGGKGLLQRSKVSPKLVKGGIPKHKKFEKMLRVINQAHTATNLADGLCRLGAGMEEASKLVDIGATAFANATLDLFGVTFFCSARHCKRFAEWDELVPQLFDNCFDPSEGQNTIDFVVTGRGPNLMGVPVKHAKARGIPTIGIPADIPAEHRDMAKDCESDVVLSMLHIPTRKNVMNALSDVVFLLDSGLGGDDERADVTLQGQLQLQYGRDAVHPFIKRRLPPRVVLVGSIWARWWAMFEEMENQTTAGRSEIPFVSIIPDHRDLPTEGSRLIREHAEALKRERMRLSPSAATA